MPLQECLLIQQVRNVQPMHDCTIARRPLWLQATQRMLALVLEILAQIGKLQPIQAQTFRVHCNLYYYHFYFDSQSSKYQYY